MTAQARDDRDKPFSDWLRKQPKLDSVLQAVYATDIDMTLYKYKPSVDRVGTRDVKLMMDVEVKTFGAAMGDQQRETLFFRHQLLKNIGTRAQRADCTKQLLSTFLNRRVAVWHFGQYVLRLLDGARPDSCSAIEWNIFSASGRLLPRVISEETLIQVLSFILRPDDMKPLALRRHHKTHELFIVDHSGLFPVDRRIVRRS